MTDIPDAELVEEALSTYQLSKVQLIEEAFDLIGVGAEGEAITADMYRRAGTSLNLMIQSWNADENLWRMTEGSLTLVAGVAAYILLPRPMRVRSVRRKVTLGGYETPLTELSRQEYYEQSARTSPASTPTSFYFDPQAGSGTLYVSPAPSAAVSDLHTLTYTYQRRMFIMDTSGDTLDFPQEWQETVTTNLARRLMLKYPVNDASVAASIIDMSDRLYAKMKAFDNEPASMYLMPDYRDYR